MIKYAKIINEENGLCEVGLGSNSEYYTSIGMMELNVEQSEKDKNWYLTEKCPHKTAEEKELEEKNRQINEIEKEMARIDQKRIRAICENGQKDETTSWLQYYNSIIINLRNDLSELIK